MGEAIQTQASFPPALLVTAGKDRYGEHRGLGISSIKFKVTAQDSTGMLIVRTHSERKAARRDICITTRMSGSILLKVNSYLRLDQRNFD
jgi:hypothetical protein